VDRRAAAHQARRAGAGRGGGGGGGGPPSLDERARALVSRTKAAGAERVCVGIGVTTPDHAREVAGYADGVIVGSALVRPMLDAGRDGIPAMRAIAESLAAAAHDTSSRSAT